jgi:large subunit ribosomal protein L32
MHRAHDFLTAPPLAVESTTGEAHLRHHISPAGFYRGKKSSRVRASNRSMKGRQFFVSCLPFILP